MIRPNFKLTPDIDICRYMWQNIYIYNANMTVSMIKRKEVSFGEYMHFLIASPWNSNIFNSKKQNLGLKCY